MNGIWKAVFGRVSSCAEYAKIYFYRKLNYKIINISYPNRIGHLVLEVDSQIKKEILSGNNPKKLFLLDFKEGFANQHIVKYFRKYIRVVSRHSIVDFSNREETQDFKLSTAHFAVAMYETANAFAVNNAWGDRKALFECDSADLKALRDFLGRCGMKPDDWYVALHARGAGYSPDDERFHSYRNVEIDSYRIAVDEIAAKGGWCIRMGDPTMDPHPQHERVIDYALSADKSAQLDVAIASQCRFFLGSSSGLANLAQLFGRPCALTNVAPLSAVYSMRPGDLSIPQKVCKVDGNEVDIRELLQSKWGNLRITEEFVDEGLVNIPNTAKQIHELTCEMLDKTDGISHYSDDDIMRQKEFRKLFKPGHYSFGSPADIGREYLKENFNP